MNPDQHQPLPRTVQDLQATPGWRVAETIAGKSPFEVPPACETSFDKSDTDKARSAPAGFYYSGNENSGKKPLPPHNTPPGPPTGPPCNRSATDGTRHPPEHRRNQEASGDGSTASTSSLPPGEMRTNTPTRRQQYLAFVATVESDSKGRCDSCRHTAAEVGQPKLHVHHLMAVASIGLDDPATMDAGNTLLLCNACHSLFHPGKRTYDWQAAGRNRGFRL